MTVSPDHKPSRMPLEYTADDLRRIEGDHRNLARGMQTLSWIMDTAREDHCRCLCSLLWFKEIAEKQFKAISAHIPRSVTASPPADAQIGSRDADGPFHELGCVLMAGWQMAELIGDEGRHIAFVFDRLRRGFNDFEDLLHDAAERRVEVNAQANGAAPGKAAKPARRKVKKQQPGEPLPLAA